MSRQTALQSYIVIVACLAGATLALCGLDLAARPPLTLEHSLPYVVLFAGLGWFCASRNLYFTESNVVTMATIAQVSTLVLFPFPLALLTVGLGKGASMLHLKITTDRNWRSTVLNTSNSVLANALGGAAFHVLHGDTFLWSRDAGLTLAAFPAVAALGLCYHLVDTGIVTGAITLNSGERPDSVFSQISRETLLPEVSLIAVGIIFAILFHFSPVLSVFILVPVFLSMRSFSAVARLQKETVEAVLKMAESIDYRDTGTYAHSERLADSCGRLASAMGLTPEHIREVVLAARVHDLGKIGISNEILLKQGPLTVQERQIMEEHPVIWSSILSSYSAFKQSVDIVRHHHERWDGNGYPDRLKGEAIPIGSRIITVVDSFDAMTSDRPYRKGMPVTEAVERLKAGMGSQFDPRACACYIQLLIEEGSYVPADSVRTLHIVAKEA